MAGVGSVYLRLGTSGEQDITGSLESPFEFGRIRYFRDGTGDMAVVSYGLIMHQATDTLRDGGRSVTLVSTPTLNPLDLDGLAEVLRSHRQVVVKEDDESHGGLASQMKQLAWDVVADCDLRTFTRKDEFIHRYGSHVDLLSAHVISTARVLQDLL
jgi:transketolase